ncbi:MAG TPA: hypothetical protein PK458_20420 [Phycisphaerae bacterium]|mgnify:CR=1 FL=1|nr:hypothetical protein [Phycisphaerae bacterium]
MNWKSGAMWAGVATAIGLALSHVLTSEQALAVTTGADQVVQVLAVAGTAVAAFIAGLGTRKSE